MLKRYFKISDDTDTTGYWVLSDPTDQQGQEVDDPWQFTNGCAVNVGGRLKVPVDLPGRPRDVSLAGIGVTPVVHEKVAALFAELASEDVQLIPVDIVGQPEQYFILVATRALRCIDDEASEEVQYWKPEDGRPDRAGEYRAVYGMRIDPTKVGDAKVFRTKGWEIALIVSEGVKEALERAGVTGVSFKEVTGPSETSPEERERWRKYRELWQTTDTAREEVWHTLGNLAEESIIPIVVGGSWPSRRQAWRVIHRPWGHLLVTDGLSDPFYGQTEPSVGFGLELALETNEPLGDVKKSWPLLLLERVADEVAEHAHVRERVMAGFLSMEVSGRDLPRRLVTEEGRVGVLMGMESSTLPRHFTLPSGQVRLVIVKALLPTELAYLLAHGRKGRDELVRRFTASGEGHLSGDRRHSVV